ncbi:MAG: LacI family DNA-binding transcriptional regulator [Chloroflexi bacterium]|nr:LacI family DNA-binding transcriptional regulator [Chloroflexota bacterium]
MATIKDVARRAEVSIATVSYVLNGRESVSQSTRERVLQAVRELGYRPNVLAQGLQAGESRMIGYSWNPAPPDQFNPILDKFLQSMIETAEKAGYHILPFPCPPDHAQVEAYEALIATNRVDGFVLSSTNLNDQRIAYLMEIGFPFVAFGRANPDWDFAYVDVDNQGGVREAIEHLLALGHRRIGLIAWPEDSLTGTLRLQGYLEAMASAGISVDPAWIVRTEHTVTAGQQAAGQLLDLPADRRPTAIMAVSDFMAIGAMNAIQNRGLGVGRDVAIIGFDDAPLVQYLRPPLTSVRQPIVEAGQRIMDMLIRLIREEPLVERHVLLTPSLIIRESSGGPVIYE